MILFNKFNRFKSVLFTIDLNHQESCAPRETFVDYYLNAKKPGNFDNSETENNLICIKIIGFLQVSNTIWPTVFSLPTLCVLKTNHILVNVISTISWIAIHCSFGWHHFPLKVCPCLTKLHGNMKSEPCYKWQRAL